MSDEDEGEVEWYIELAESVPLPVYIFLVRYTFGYASCSPDRGRRAVRVGWAVLAANHSVAGTDLTGRASAEGAKASVRCCRGCHGCNSGGASGRSVGRVALLSHRRHQSC